MAATIQLTFYIYLTDQAQVAAYQAQYPNGVSRGVIPASVEFGAPYIADGQPITYPCTRTGWIPAGGAGVFPLDRAFFTINDGFFGHLFGRNQKYAWIGQFVYQAPAAAPIVQLALSPTPDPVTGIPPVVVVPPVTPEDTTPGPMREIAFAIGFEGTPIGSATAPDGSTTSQGNVSRDASRMPEGYGYALRNPGSAFQVNWNVHGATTIGRGWERMYFRIRKKGVLEVPIWRMRWGSNVGLGNSGLFMGIDTSGSIVVRNISSGGAFFPAVGSGFMGQTPTTYADGRWHVLDILYTNTLASSQAAQLWVDHVKVLDITGFAHGEGAVVRTIDSSLIGLSTVGNSNSLGEVDIDDWIGFILPASAQAGVNELWQRNTPPTPSINPGPDWTHGHHVAYVPPQAFDASHSANWTGDVRGLEQRASTAQAEDILTCTTSGALAAVSTRADLVVAQDRSLGWQAFTINALTKRAVGGTPQLGYTYDDGSGPVTAMSNIANPSATNTWNWTAKRLVGELQPKARLTQLMLRFTKAADANSTQLNSLFATVALVGTFSPCDGAYSSDGGTAPETPDPLRHGIQNSHYPRSLWNRTEVRPDSPVWVKAGTYAGNNLGQDIIAKIPAHFWWIRATNNVTGAVKWWATMTNSHWVTGTPQGAGMSAMQDPNYTSPGLDTSPEEQSLIRVGGPVAGQAAENLTGVTYQYLAIGDPGGRFLLAGSFSHDNAMTAEINNLIDANFTPEFMLCTTETPAGGGFMFLKGPGHATPNGQRMDAAEVTTFGDFAAGRFTSRVTLHPAALASVPYVMFRNRDGADYASLGLTEPVIVQIMSYVGDGAASRTIQLPRTSGKRPLWAICCPTPGNAHVRDASHTTNTSSLWNAGNATIATGFTAGGVDSVTVGSTLNANGVTHNMMVVMAPDATAGANGWGTNGEVLYDPVPAPGSQYDTGYTQAELDELENPTVPSESFDDGETLEDDLADTLCVPYVKRAVNLALVRLGISNLVTAATDLTAPTCNEHTLIAQFYEHCLRATLRDFPWPHATRYAQLVLSSGSEDDPENGDWIYKFRAPTGILFARRLVPAETDGRKFNEAPIPFRMSEDAIGPCLFTNEVREAEDGTLFVELEYTVRPHCGSKAAGDQLFVSTFAWRLASEMGLPLAKDTKFVERCEKNYQLARSVGSTATVREQQQEDEGDASWINER